MPALCACGTNRVDYDGCWICAHCDGNQCEGGCERCRTYSIVTGKRVSA